MKGLESLRELYPDLSEEDMKGMFCYVYVLKNCMCFLSIRRNHGLSKKQRLFIRRIIIRTVALFRFAINGWLRSKQAM